MSDVLVVAGHALRESLRRRVFAVVVGLTLAFGVLYTWGTSELFQDVDNFGGTPGGRDDPRPRDVRDIVPRRGPRRLPHDRGGARRRRARAAAAPHRAAARPPP